MRDSEQAELRSREENTRREQTRSFAQLIQDGQSLFGSLNEEKELTAKNLKLTGKNLENITGGDEYCWLVPVNPLPVGVGGNPAYQGNNWWQLALKNSGSVVLPTCDVLFMPFPTDEELKGGAAPPPPFLSYHFEKILVTGRRYYRYTQYLIKGDRIYSGVIETPTQRLNEVIKFDPDPNHATQYIPKCTVMTQKLGKILEKDCNPQ